MKKRKVWRYSCEHCGKSSLRCEKCAAGAADKQRASVARRREAVA